MAAWSHCARETHLLNVVKQGQKDKQEQYQPEMALFYNFHA
jgi:hypothetical protein